MTNRSVVRVKRHLARIQTTVHSPQNVPLKHDTKSHCCRKTPYRAALLAQQDKRACDMQRTFPAAAMCTCLPPLHMRARSTTKSTHRDERTRGGLGPRVAAVVRHKRPETTAGARDSLFSHRVLLRRVVGLNKERKRRTGIASRPFG